ncbi:mechanosensitive ion channel family protein [Rhizobium binxianense]
MSVDILKNPIVQFCLLVVAGLLLRLTFGRNPRFRFVANVVFFILLTVVLLSHGIAPYMPDVTAEGLTQRIFTGLAKTVWWIGGAMVLVSSVRLFLIFERKPREGRLLQDLIVGLIYLGAGLSVIAYVFSVPVGTLIATSGAFAIVLGLALQSTLNDVFSGIALNLGRPYTVGDWIVLEDGVEGRVVETSWRSTYLLSGTNDLVIVPNSRLAKARLVNLSSPDETHGISVTIRILPTQPPSVITEVMRTVLLSSTVILKEPEPSVTIKELTGDAVEVELSCRVSGIGRVAAARNELYDLVYRHAKATGLTLAGAPAEQPEGKSSAPATPLRLLSAVPLFSTLTEDEREALASGATRLTYRKDTVIAGQDTVLASLMVIRGGVVVVEREEEGRKIELNRLAPGDFFGEGGVLIGAEEPGTIRALTFVVVYEISKERLAAVMQDRPSLAEELALILSKRLDSEKHLAMHGVSPNGRHPTSLTARIRHLFQIQHEG